ncbi:hypothetical protein BKA62DRAFT_775919 [Auriculariales sp. MPI-PUGE-AT-0066]|nr:hypothetical protein BKA62DRAFT_775919 [Auriculariales sp. MPI-PUGE-AT-0066]
MNYRSNNVNSGPDLCLPIELILEILHLAVLTNRDACTAWTASLALVAPSFLGLVRAGLYEIYRVDVSRDGDRMGHRALVTTSPSIREFVRMLMNASDPRRAHVKCLVFCRDPRSLLPLSLKGAAWNVNTIVAAYNNTLSAQLPPMPLVSRYLALYFEGAHRGVRKDLMLAPQAEWHRIHIGDANVPDDSYHQYSYVGYLPRATPRTVWRLFTSPMTTWYRRTLTVFSTSSALGNLSGRPLEGMSVPVISRQDLVELLRSFPSANQQSSEGIYHWSNRDWAGSLLEHPESYRDLLCGSTWDIGEPLWTSNDEYLLQHTQ